MFNRLILHKYKIRNLSSIVWNNSTKLGNSKIIAVKLDVEKKIKDWKYYEVWNPLCRCLNSYSTLKKLILILRDSILLVLYARGTAQKWE